MPDLWDTFESLQRKLSTFTSDDLELGKVACRRDARVSFFAIINIVEYIYETFIISYSIYPNSTTIFFSQFIVTFILSLMKICLSIFFHQISSSYQFEKLNILYFLILINIIWIELEKNKIHLFISFLKDYPDYRISNFCISIELEQFLPDSTKGKGKKGII